MNLIIEEKVIGLKLCHIFFTLALGGRASDMLRDTHCATSDELVFLKLYLSFFSNTIYSKSIEIILNKFGTVAGTPKVPTKKI